MTTDRETRTGITEETDGDYATFVMTNGGFVRKCPTAEGIAHGTFEFSFAADIVETVNGETQRKHFVKRLTAELEGHVGDDMWIDFVEGTAQFMSERDGQIREQKSYPIHFRPRRDLEPDWPSMLAAVEASGELLTANLILQAGVIFLSAQLEWMKLNECVEFTFDPPTESRWLDPNESANVRVQLRTKDGHTGVSEAKFEDQPIYAIGTVTPREGETAADGAFTLTYTAAANPRPGNGIDVVVRASRAGSANGLWKIVEIMQLRLTAVTEINAEGLQMRNELAPVDIPLQFYEDGTFVSEAILGMRGAGAFDECTAQSTNGVRLAVTGKTVTRSNEQFLVVTMKPASASSTSGTVRCPEFGMSRQTSGLSDESYTVEIKKAIGATAAIPFRSPDPAVTTTGQLEVVRMH